jgi:hypothetical protein
MTPLGYALMFLGCSVCLYGQARILVVAYKRNLWWFFGCLFVPLVDWIFFFLNLKATLKPFILSLVGLILAGLGASIAGIV